MRSFVRLITEVFNAKSLRGAMGNIVKQDRRAKLEEDFVEALDAWCIDYDQAASLISVVKSKDPDVSDVYRFVYECKMWDKDQSKFVDMMHSACVTAENEEHAFKKSVVHIWKSGQFMNMGGKPSVNQTEQDRMPKINSVPL